MELEADDGSYLRRGGLMAAVRFVFTVDYVAEILDEDVDLVASSRADDGAVLDQCACHVSPLVMFA